MAVVAISDSILTDIADAIREQLDTEDTYKPSEMADAIGEIRSATLGTKTITSNGTYDSEDDSLDGYSEVTVNVSGGGITPTGTKNITANGTNIDVAQYAYADVAVSNTYAVGDEGKVVSNGALVSQTSDTFTENDTYDTTLINSLTVNVSGSSGVSYDDIAMKNFSGNIVLSTATKIKTNTFYSCPNVTGIESDTVTELEGGAFAYNANATKIRLPKVTKIANYGLQRNTNANMAPIVMPVLTTLGTYMFERVKATLDFTATSNLVASSLRNWYGDKLILRKSDAICTLANINAFEGSPFASNGSGGTLYVPNALIASYQANSTWATILGYANNQIKSIESTHTDPDAFIDLTIYYADGTEIS